MRTIEIKGIEFQTVAEPGVPFAYIHDHPMPDGTYRTRSVPVNDRD
jgi:hypothetical protein